MALISEAVKRDTDLTKSKVHSSINILDLYACLNFLDRKKPSQPHVVIFIFRNIFVWIK